MSDPGNSAARNTMSEFERQCYDWGFEDAEERIIKLLENQHNFDQIFLDAVDQVIALIKGEKNE